MAKSLGIGKSMVFTGHLGDARLLDALYHRASLFVFPSLYDTSGLVVREAAAMGTPSVVVRGSSAAEGVRDGETGFLCEDDPEDLARTIASALADPAALARVGERARAEIPIPWNSIVDNAADVYAQIIRRAKEDKNA